MALHNPTKRALKIMITPDTIEEIKNRLITVYKPIRIYLFGSYAWGNPTEESDLDLLVVVEKSDETQAARARKASDPLWDLMVPYELLVFTEDEFDESSQSMTNLSHKIKNDGRVLYARS